MPIHLVVVRPFAGYAKGASVSDAETISEILASPHAFDVVRVNATKMEG